VVCTAVKNKRSETDARAFAQMMRVGLFKPVHVKTQMAQEQRMLLTSRKLLQRKLLDVESVASTGKFEARIRELVAGSPRLALIVEPLLAVRRVMRQQFAVLHKSFVVTAMWPAGWVVPAKRQTSPADALELHNCTKTSASNTLATENLPRHSPWGFIINANCSSQPHESPHKSYRSENICEERLLLQHEGEALHQRAEPIFRHVWD
jgi:hypothetical protein